MRAATALSKGDDVVAAIKTELLLLNLMMAFTLAGVCLICAKLFLH
jgi:hypothetical protein